MAIKDYWPCLGQQTENTGLTIAKHTSLDVPPSLVELSSLSKQQFSTPVCKDMKESLQTGVENCRFQVRKFDTARQSERAVT